MDQRKPQWNADAGDQGQNFHIDDQRTDPQSDRLKSDQQLTTGTSPNLPSDGVHPGQRSWYPQFPPGYPLHNAQWG